MQQFCSVSLHWFTESLCLFNDFFSHDAVGSEITCHLHWDVQYVATCGQLFSKNAQLFHKHVNSRECQNIVHMCFLYGDRGKIWASWGCCFSHVLFHTACAVTCMGRHDGGREDAKSDASSSSSNGSQNESEADFDRRSCHCRSGGEMGRVADLGDAEVLFARHKLSRCIHSLQDETGTCFKCGRGMSYTLVKRKPDFVHPLCNTCFRPDGM